MVRRPQRAHISQKSCLKFDIFLTNLTILRNFLVKFVKSLLRSLKMFFSHSILLTEIFSCSTLFPTVEPYTTTVTMRMTIISVSVKDNVITDAVVAFITNVSTVFDIVFNVLKFCFF